MANYHITKKSSNAKTGPMMVTTTSADTCPPSCGMFNTCYAKGGPQLMHWRKVTNGERGGNLAELCDAISALPENTVWRHNVSGDLPGEGETIDAPALAKIVKANTGRRGFTYTHKKPVGLNAQAIAAANRGGFTINLSADSAAQADELAALNIAPVVTVVPIDQNENTTTPAGRKIVICPATQRDDVTCKSCKLCQVRDRGVIVGFPVHGSRKRLANENLLKEG